MEIPYQDLLILLNLTYPLFLCHTLHLHVRYKARTAAFPPEVQPPDDPCLDLLCPILARSLDQNNMGKYEGLLGITLLIKNPSPLHHQDFRKPAPAGPWKRCMTYVQLCVQPETVEISNRFDGHIAIHLRPIIVMEVIALYFHQELMGPGQVTHLPLSWTPLEGQWFCAPSVLR